MIKKLCLMAYMGCHALLALAQPGTIMPQKPAQGDMITVAYKTTDAQAELNGKEQIYARITNYLQDGGIKKFHVALITARDAIANQFKLPPHTASFKVEFYTLNKDDDEAGENLLVYNADHQAPVRGAYMQDFFADKPDSVFQKEINNYPDNYLAYAKYINVISMVKPGTAKEEIVAMLNKLEMVHGADNSAGLLSALCIGYAKTGDLNKGKAYLFNLFEKYPATAETAFAFSIYNYEYYKASSKEVEEDVRRNLKVIFIDHPDAAISKDENVFHYLQNDKTIPLIAFERVLKPLYITGEVSYHALNNLPEVYMANHTQLDSAEALLNKGIMQFQDGSINHQYRLNSGHYQMYVPFMLLDLVKINLLKKEYRLAINNASAAINILSGSNTEGNFVPLLLPLRADAYKQSGNLNLAMEDYKKLYRAGDAGALDSMRLIFKQCNLPQKTFEQFEASLKANSKTPSSTTSLQAAPDFTATDLQGKTIRLANLKGKIVVVNIWGIGCGPCIAEMPRLNQLVKQYGSRKDLVFLAISADKTADLHRFFKTKHFDYMVVNGVSNLSEKFNTNALPVHIVIGKQGEIISRSIGARADIKEYLQQVINSNL
ncbi:MAG: TlpA disulfide reductase family protein [Bacteroidota bacterium]